MSDDFGEKLSAINQTVLTPPVRRFLNDETVEVVDWQIQPVSGGFSQVLGNSPGVYRIRGQAQGRHETMAWSLILKALHAPPGSNKRREVLAYQSGLLDDLPGDLVAPSYFGTIEYPDDEVWLWLEDIPEAYSTGWPLDRYGLAAQHLGQFNGTCLTTLCHHDASRRNLRSRPAHITVPIFGKKFSYRYIIVTDIGFL